MKMQLFGALATVVAASVLVATIRNVDAFPSLFTRATSGSSAPLFRPRNQQQQQQQPQLQQVASTDQMSMQFPVTQFGSRGQFAPDQSAAAAHAHALAAAMAAVAQQQQQQQQQPSGAASAPHYFRPSQASFGQAEPISAHLLGSAGELHSHPAEAAAEAAAFGQVPSAADSSADYARESSQLGPSQGRPMLGDGAGSGSGLEQSQSGEVVDKIERHISHQIDQALGSSQYGEAQKSSAPEKDSSGSESGSEGSSADEGSAVDMAEKRSHEPAEAKHHEEHHSHHSHHEEHPPEAFEVHHKKGGKSFQYFHQGHHH